MDKRTETYIDMVLTHEGGYSSGKDKYSSGDAGGETYCGIARNANPKWEGWKIVDKNKPLKYNQKIKDDKLAQMVRDLYYEKYYKPIKADQIDDDMIAAHLFCHGVNAGLKASVKLLQKAINKVCKQNIQVDGIIGKVTLSYANNGTFAKLIASEFIAQRNAFYRAIVAKNKTQAKFLNGWLNRVKGTTKVAEEYTKNNPKESNFIPVHKCKMV